MKKDRKTIETEEYKEYKKSEKVIERAYKNAMDCLKRETKSSMQLDFKTC